MPGDDHNAAATANRAKPVGRCRFGALQGFMPEDIVAATERFTPVPAKGRHRHTTSTASPSTVRSSRVRFAFGESNSDPRSCDHHGSSAEAFGVMHLEPNTTVRGPETVEFDARSSQSAQAGGRDSTVL